jgi:adenylate cyclase
MTATTRRKLAAVLMAMAIFACLGAVTTAAVGRPVEIGTFNAILIGAGIGLFEEFYVQGPRGNWMREMHPLRSIFIYILVVIVLYLVALHITHLVLGRLDDLPVVPATALWNSVLHGVLGRWHPDDQGRPFHRVAHAARPYDWHLSSPG